MSMMRLSHYQPVTLEEEQSLLEHSITISSYHAADTENEYQSVENNQADLSKHQ